MERYVLIGLDGSGKSANLNKMKQDPLFDGFQFAWVRWEPKLLRPLYRIIHKRTSKKPPSATNPAQTAHTPNDTNELAERYSRTQQLKKRIFSSRLVARLWIAAALADYLIQFHLKYKQLEKGGGNIVFDRYYFDLFVDQGLNAGYTPERIAQDIGRYAFLFPKIKKVIYIRVDPAVCLARKNDIPDMDYLLRRYAVYELLSQTFGWLTVDGEKSLEEVYATIRSAILEA